MPRVKNETEKAEVSSRPKELRSGVCSGISVSVRVCVERHQIKSEKPTGNSPSSKAVGEQAVF